MKKIYEIPNLEISELFREDVLNLSQGEYGMEDNFDEFSN